MPQLITDKDKEYLRRVFSERLRKPVTILFFTREQECLLCKETRQFLDELVPLSDLLRLEVHELPADDAVAKLHGIDKVPAIKLRGEQDFGVRFFGIPMGYEFIAIVEDIIDVSWGAADLPAKAMELILAIDKPVHIQVFVSPTCPYCPQVVRAAHKFAILNEFVTADMVEVTEFPEMAKRYEVQGVPRIVANETSVMVGAYPDTSLAQFAYFASEGKPASVQGKDAPAGTAPSTQVTPIAPEK
jgi:glutaredoxin-like protein